MSSFGRELNKGVLWSSGAISKVGAAEGGAVNQSISSQSATMDASSLFIGVSALPKFSFQGD